MPEQAADLTPAAELSPAIWDAAGPAVAQVNSLDRTAILVAGVPITSAGQ